jgi:hypothetical protein
MRRLVTLVAVSSVSLLASACSSLNPSSQPTTTGVGGAVDCTIVHQALAELVSARAKLTTANNTSSKQIAAAVATITAATEALAGQSESALPGQTSTWLRLTEAYNRQIQQGARDGRSPTFLIQAAHSFDTAGYREAAKAVGTYLSGACSEPTPAS